MSGTAHVRAWALHAAVTSFAQRCVYLQGTVESSADRITPFGGSRVALTQGLPRLVSGQGTFLVLSTINDPQE